MKLLSLATLRRKGDTRELRFLGFPETSYRSWRGFLLSFCLKVNWNMVSASSKANQFLGTEQKKDKDIPGSGFELLRLLLLPIFFFNSNRKSLVLYFMKD